jgi:hypothetical protein
MRTDTPHSLVSGGGSLAQPSVNFATNYGRDLALDLLFGRGHAKEQRFSTWSR